MELVYDALEVKEAMTNSIASEYVHYDKAVVPGQIIKLGNTRLKWYSISTVDAGIPLRIETIAREYLQRESLAGNLGDIGSLGFVILHRCETDFYFLLLATWKNANELWESVFAKDADEQPDFDEFSFDTHHRGAFCVWELASVTHEKSAWKRFLYSNRNADAEDQYLNDLYHGIA
jgi:hypothetical protein